MLVCCAVTWVICSLFCMCQLMGAFRSHFLLLKIQLSSDVHFSLCGSPHLSFSAFHSLLLLWSFVLPFAHIFSVKLNLVLLSHFMTSHPTPFLFRFNDHYFLNLYRISQARELSQMKYIAFLFLLSFFFLLWQHFPFDLSNKNYGCVNVRGWLTFWTSQRTDKMLPIDFLI